MIGFCTVPAVIEAMEDAAWRRRADFIGEMRRDMDKILERLASYGVVPVAVLDDCMAVLPLMQALAAGGLPCAEIAFRTPAAEQSIRLAKAAYPEMLIGAGTVISISQVDRAMEAGAEFIVSPGMDNEIIRYCIEREITVIPGCVTPSELMEAVKYGLQVVKFFPAEQCGGLEAIEAISAPFPQIKFMPTGGINADNMGKYLANDKVVACGGSWMVKKGLIASNAFEEIEKLTAKAVHAVSVQRKYI